MNLSLHGDGFKLLIEYLVIDEDEASAKETVYAASLIHGIGIAKGGPYSVARCALDKPLKCSFQISNCLSVGYA